MWSFVQNNGWERVAMAVEEVRDWLQRAMTMLEAGRMAHAVTDGNGVEEWIGRVDKADMRFTQDVDLLIRRADLPVATAVLEAAGFVYRHFA